MNNVRFSILVLGDCSYKDYCKTGDDFRKKFLEMVAKEIYLLVECNIDYEKGVSHWAREVAEVFARVLPPKTKTCILFIL